MLTIGRLAAGQESYYLDAVASGVEDYYVGSGEVAGRWTGAGALGVGLAGEVDPAALRTVLAGIDPATGEQRTRRATACQPRVPGFDLTFSAPKSVSVLWALGDGEIPVQVVEAHRAAVAGGLSYLEGNATFTRRRRNRVLEAVAGEGLIVAAFRHRTSRAGDPQLHTHCVTANMVRAVDGTWGTLDSRSLYHHARTAGFVYQAIVRGELTSRLGVAWGEVHNGHAEVLGLPPTLLRTFSKRRAEIEQHLGDRGQHSAASAQAANLVTRRGKAGSVEPVALRSRWQTQARAVGFAVDQIDRVVGRQVAPGDLDVGEVRASLASADGLTARQASFDRRDVLRSWCERFAGQAVTLAGLEANSDALLASPSVVALGGDEGVMSSRGVRLGCDRRRARFSTAEMLEVERNLLHGADRRQSAAVGLVAAKSLVMSLASSAGLSAEQASMVRRLTSSGAGVEVVVGKAGTGKTFALSVAAAAWRAAGHRVSGVALAARAADELHRATAIPATTVAQLLADLDQPGASLGPRHVLVVDEAGMVDTRRLARVLGVAERDQAKVVLVGDHRQLPEIHAGGAFRGLLDRLGAIELYENRRQRHGWERAVLDQLREGAVTAALSGYQRRDRLRQVERADLARREMVSAWHRARGDGQRSIMVAISNRDVDDLNATARGLRLDAGDIRGPGLVVGDRSFARGDEILCLRNDRRIGVINSTIATVAKVDFVERSLEVELADGSVALIPAHYLDAGHVSHAYATTIHKAQGMTVDRTFLLADDRLYREAGYVGLSRGRDANELFVVSRDRDEALEQHRSERTDPDPYQDLARALERSGAKQLATDLVQSIGPPASGAVQVGGGHPGNAVDPPPPSTGPATARTEGVEIEL